MGRLTSRAADFGDETAAGEGPGRVDPADTFLQEGTWSESAALARVGFSTAQTYMGKFVGGHAGATGRRSLAEFFGKPGLLAILADVGEDIFTLQCGYGDFLGAASTATSAADMAVAGGKFREFFDYCIVNGFFHWICVSLLGRNVGLSEYKSFLFAVSQYFSSWHSLKGQEGYNGVATGLAQQDKERKERKGGAESSGQQAERISYKRQPGKQQ